MHKTRLQKLQPDTVFVACHSNVPSATQRQHWNRYRHEIHYTRVKVTSLNCNRVYTLEMSDVCKTEKMRWEINMLTRLQLNHRWPDKNNTTRIKINTEPMANTKELINQSRQPHRSNGMYLVVYIAPWQGQLAVHGSSNDSEAAS